MHRILRGCGGMLPQENLKFRLYESASEAVGDSLVPRPEEGKEEKGPGFSRSRMRLIIC